MVNRRPSSLLNLLLEDGVFHQDSVILYTDRSWSIGAIDSKKTIDWVFPIDRLDTPRQDRKPFPLLYHLEHCKHMPQAEAMLMVDDIKRALIERRGIDHAFHYDGGERNLIHGAALIAAREPETAALYFDMNNTNGYLQRFRLIVSPDLTIGDIHIDGTKTVRGVHMPFNGTLVVSHLQDRKGPYLTVHELVHAFDKKIGYISDKIPQELFDRTTSRIRWLDALCRKWQEAPETLTPDEKAFTSEWQEKLQLLPSRSAAIEGVKPYTEEEARKVLSEVLNNMIRLTRLSPVSYPTDNARRMELLPVFEEEVARMGQSRLDPNDPGRKVAEFLMPDIGAFDRANYLPALRREYDKAKRSRKIRLEGDDIAKPLRPIRASLVHAQGRVEKDRDLSDAERAEITTLRNRLRSTLVRSANFLPQSHTVTAEDGIAADLITFYEKKHPRQQAIEMAQEELAAMREAVDRGSDQARI